MTFIPPPKTLGLPDEVYTAANKSSASHYRCTIKGFNVFVWSTHKGGYYVAAGRQNTLVGAAAMFYEEEKRGRAARIDTTDPITLLSVIYELTSGGNDV